MAKKKKRARKISNVIYAFVLLIFGLALSAVAVLWLGRVSDYAEQYELSRPSHTIDAYMEALNRDRWSPGIAETVAGLPHETQSDEEIKAFIQDRLSAGMTAVRHGSSSDAGSISYSIRCRGKEIGVVTLQENPNYPSKVDFAQMPWPLVKKFLPGILEWGLKPWQVAGEKFTFDGIYNTVEVVVPENYEVWVNGVKLDESYITERGIPYDVYEKYYQYWDYLPKKVRYYFDHAIGEAKVEIRNAAGEPVTIDPNKGDIQFTEPVSAEVFQEYNDFCVPFMTAYLRYTAGVGGTEQVRLQELKQYLLPGADMESRMIDALDGLSWGHTDSVSVDSVTLNSVLPLTDGFTACDITGVTTTVAHGRGEETKTISMVVLVYDDGSQLLAESYELY